MSKIPHPFIIESIEVLDDINNKSGVHFIHLNHTNPALSSDSKATDFIKKQGFSIAEKYQKFSL